MSLRTEIADCIRLIEALEGDFDDARAGDAIRRCRAVLPRLKDGDTLLMQVEKLVLAQNPSRAVRLIRSVPARRGVPKVLGSIGTLLLVAAFAAAVGFLGPSSCGGDAAIEAANACPAAVYELGSPIAHSPLGLGCGESETSGSSGWSEWTIPIAGTEKRGSYSFEAEMSGGQWTVLRAQVEVDGRVISVVPCETPR